MRYQTDSIEQIFPYVLRYFYSGENSFATHLMQRGADIATIAECLGHASISNTQKYTHVTMVDVINNYDKAHPRA